MATDLIKAADDARRILKGFKAFAEVADALDAAGQIEQRTAEAQRVLADLQPKIEAAKAAVADAEEQASNTLAVASQQAAGLVDSAKVKADRIVSDAQARADRVNATADTVAINAGLTSKKVVEEVKEALAQRNALAKECDELEARLAKAKAYLATLAS